MSTNHESNEDFTAMGFVYNKYTFKVEEMVVKSFKYYGATDHNKEIQIRGAC